MHGSARRAGYPSDSSPAARQQTDSTSGRRPVALRQRRRSTPPPPPPLQAAVRPGGTARCAAPAPVRAELLPSPHPAATAARARRPATTHRRGGGPVFATALGHRCEPGPLLRGLRAARAGALAGPADRLLCGCTLRDAGRRSGRHGGRRVGLHRHRGAGHRAPGRRR
jgi:hypothetical protein